MSRFAHKAVSIGAALAMVLSLVGSAFAEEPTIAATTQSGSNVAQVVQTGQAGSGDAVATSGAKATTGNVKVEAEVDVSQEIDQKADTSATGGSVAETTQTATNTSNVSQGVVATSGDAVATGHGAQASTGDVHVEASVEKDQEIEQEADTEASAEVVNGTASVTSTPSVVTPGIASTVQTASNTDIVIQTVLAQSGDAVAFGPHAKATTGYVKAEAEVEDEQEIEQNDGRHGGETEAIGGIASVVQTASQTSNVRQALRAWSGDAVASVEFEDDEAESAALVNGSFPFHFGLAVAETGDVYAEAEVEIEQEIEQDADTYADLFEEDGGAPFASITQAAFNTAIAYQFVTAFSGDASAFATFGEEEEDTATAEKGSNGIHLVGAKASTGDVYAEFEIEIEQEIEQKADATAIGPDAIAFADQDVDNDAANFAGFIQGSTTGSSWLWAYSGDAAAFSEDWEGSDASSGDAGSWKHPIEYELEADQEIEQETDTFAGAGVIWD